MDQNNQVEQWSEAVIVQNGSLTPVIIHSADEALDYMQSDWPVENAKHHQIAQEICLAAIRQQVSAEAARENFIRAVIEARIKVCAPETTVSDPQPSFRSE